MTKVEKYTQEAIAIANDNSHGYSQASRWGTPDYDCSSMVISVVQNAGIPVKSKGSTYTGNMYGNFHACGFQDVTNQVNLYSGSGMKRGDILLNDVNHTAIYIGNGQLVHARSDDGFPQAGDQTGNEIRVQAYFNYSHGGWNHVLRYPNNVEYDPNESTAVNNKNYPKIIMYGDEGKEVKQLQENLNKLGFDCGVADGQFGKATLAAVQSFQRDAGLFDDGEAGPLTQTAIDERLDGKPSGDESKHDQIDVKDKKWIWDALRAKGLSEAAVASVMGNMELESNCVSYRLQGDFTEGYRKSIDYTVEVDNGNISRNDFVYHGPGGGGYGLCQWTYSTRKMGLYDKAKSMGVSIGDTGMQIDWFMDELNQPGNAAVKSSLMNGKDIYTMTQVILTKFEMPADQSANALNKRVNAANSIYNQFAEGKDDEPENPDEPTPEPDEPVEDDKCTVKVRVLRYGSKGTDVFMLQNGLTDIGYSCGIPDGDFGTLTEAGVNEFRLSLGLPDDGTADGKVWQNLFEK